MKNIHIHTQGITAISKKCMQKATKPYIDQTIQEQTHRVGLKPAKGEICVIVECRKIRKGSAL